MKTINLTKHLTTQVDDQDYAYLSQFEWYGVMGETGKWGVMADITTADGAPSTSMAKLLLQPKPGFGVAHKDGDELNNCRDNLMVIPSSECSCCLCGDPSEPTRVVFLRTDREKPWCARVLKDGKIVTVTSICSLDEAVDVWDEMVFGPLEDEEEGEEWKEGADEEYDEFAFEELGHSCMGQDEAAFRVVLPFPEDKLSKLVEQRGPEAVPQIQEFYAALAKFNDWYREEPLNEEEEDSSAAE